ncbi:MAG: hypothetical protein ACRD24_11625 [Terriglobales bacterium]
MKRGILIFFAGVAAGLLLRDLGPRVAGLWGEARITPQPSPICYSCAWEDYQPKVRADLIEYYRQYLPEDPLLFGDSRFALWRATGMPNCDILEKYKQVVSGDASPFRRYVAATVVAFSGPECGLDTRRYFGRAAEAAEQSGLKSEAATLRAFAGQQPPRFGDVEIRTNLTIPPHPKSMVLGESRIRLEPGMRVGTQVDRVMRDWVSAQMKWSASDQPVPRPLIEYHEGALVKRMLELVEVQVLPLPGALVARKDDKWYALDEQGVFRFHVLDDKMRYPTTHVAGNSGWVEDTHGISAMVPQAVEQRVQLVVGCGDSEGEIKAAYHLASLGVHVFIPGDRYADELLGYDAPGVILGGAPIHKVGDHVVIGSQPVRFELTETIIVQDTKKTFPMQYYDAPARYFRALARHVQLQLVFVDVDAPDEIRRILDRAKEARARAVAVRVMTEWEDAALRGWLGASRQHRAILFHSSLYPYAQKLFADFPAQVTFGDLHPRFE